jgi:hypothetical protein
MDTRRNRIKGVVNIPKQGRPFPPPAPVFGVDRLLLMTPPITSLPSTSTVQQPLQQKLPASTTTTQTLAPANQSTSSPSYFSPFHHPPMRSPMRQSLLNPLSSLAKDHSVNTNSSSSILGNSHLLRQTLSTPPRTMSNYHVLKKQLKYHHHHQTHAPVDRNKLTMLHFALMNPKPGPS